MTTRPRVLYVCTGNAARSVMATVMTRARSSQIETWGAGTHSIEGLPMSQRTRRALSAFDLADPDHLSHQLIAEDTARADLIVVFEPNHMSYMRRHHPEAAPRTAMLPGWVNALGERDVSPTQPISERVAALGLELRQSAEDEEVIDPAGGDQAVFDASAQEISALVDKLLSLLGLDDSSANPVRG